MDKETSPPPSEDEPEAVIIPFPDEDKELKEAMSRHPARGTKTTAEILAQLGLDNTPDDPDTA
ncbi:MAG: hypothetical protein H6797_00650 [Candidatus Nomurabacteria bacterium]|nr:MAG: hypothetical protein H6797_00650 [Candidatus Nomurabacteria bacterium]